MFTSYMLLATLHLGAAQAEPQSAADVAERELRKRGVRFKDVSLYALFLNRDATREELVKLGRGNLHIVIDDSQKLGRENLKYLRDLPNLKEIVVGPDFPDEWCKQLEPLTQLEGLFLGGNFNFGQGVSDLGIASIARLPNLQALSLMHSKVTDDGLRHIAGLTKLRWLSLGGAQNVTNKGLIHLKDLKSLEDLTIEATRTTAEGLVHLQGLTKLRRLRLANEVQAQEQAVGLKYLANMTELRTLDARGLCAGDDDLRPVRKMTKLEDLNLCYTKITDKGLEHLAGLTELKILDLFGTGVTGDGLKHLRNLKKLKNLVLGLCPLRDEAAEHLRHMTQLEYLEVGDTGMTKKAIEELQRQLPKTTVR
jgi:internalin A